MTATTPGLVCSHHHLYSALARGMPAPPKNPTTFMEILEQVWWRLDTALDLEMLRWSAMLGAVEALENGTTAIVDHHESPNAIEGSLDVIADACAEVGVRINTTYGITDRHGIGDRKRLRHRMGLPGRAHAGEGGIVRGAGAVEKTEEAPHCREGAGEGRGVEAVGAAAGEVAAEVGAGVHAARATTEDLRHVDESRHRRAAAVVVEHVVAEDHGPSRR